MLRPQAHKTIYRYGALLALFISGVAAHPHAVSASTGTIDTINRYAWSENAGWIDFGVTGGAVTVGDSALTGYAYGENTGWVSLNCSNTSTCGSASYSVANSNGTLSGSAWGENIGWIDFHPSGGGVTIDSSGVFHGTAYGENVGWVVFNCADTGSCGTVSYTVGTSWRPTSSGGGGSGTGINNTKPTALTATSTLAATSSVPVVPTNLATLFSTSSPTYASTTALMRKLALNTRDLTLGKTGEDVRSLQKLLNMLTFTVAAKGLGSPGLETSYFGALTQKALAAFQKANSITPSAGYFGPKTRALLSRLGFGVIH